MPAAPAASAPSVGDRIGETASAAGKHLGEAAVDVCKFNRTKATGIVGENWRRVLTDRAFWIVEAASSVGEGLSGFGSWMRPYCTAAFCIVSHDFR